MIHFKCNYKEVINAPYSSLFQKHKFNIRALPAKIMVAPLPH